MKFIKRSFIIITCLSFVTALNYGCKTSKKAAHATKKTAKKAANATGKTAENVATKVSKTVKKASKTVEGAVVGAANGALAGAKIGKTAGSTVNGTITEAAVEGSAGTRIGQYMDREADDLNSALNNADVKRVGQGIQITFNSAILFNTGSSKLNQDAKNSINNLADVLNKYDNTKLLLAGFTDSTGTQKINQKLSKQRAVAVSLYIAEQGVNPKRMVIKGYGQQNPVADNSTEAGRQKNRRVEVALYANKKLKKMAKKGTIDQGN